jgi:thiamine biosynthesis lipoprotein
VATTEVAKHGDTPTADGRLGGAVAPETVRRSFRAMGTDVTLIGPSGAPPAAFDDAFRIVRSIFDREDRRFSRFRADSEISSVNAAAGSWTTVSKPFRRVLRAALEAAETTGGLFDPTVLPALMAAGYDRDFDDIIAGARLALHPPEPCARWGEIRTRDDEVLLPEGAALDFGGIAKGWTVDLAAETIDRLMAWALVDAGGDLRIVGDVPNGGLEIAVEDPYDAAAEILRLALDRGALATTSVTLRSWGPGLHHVIDPRTARPAQTGVLQATVWAPTCAAAELGSKWALLDDERALERLPAVIVRDDGTVVTNMAHDVAGGEAIPV